MTIGDNQRPRQGATVYLTPAALASDSGPTTDTRYAYVASLDKHFVWNLTATDTPNSVTIIGTNGNGAVGVWRVVVGDDRGADLPRDVSQTLTVAGGRLRIFQPGILVSNVVITLSTTGAQAEDEIEVLCNDTAAVTVTVVNGGVGAGNIAVKPVSIRGWIRSRFDGTNWYHAGSGQSFGTA